MRIDRFDYELPPEAIAQVPLARRDASRLLDATAHEVAHRVVSDLPDLLGAGDVLVLNDTRVLPARLMLHKPTGGTVEVLLLEPLEGPAGAWQALVRPSRRVAVGIELRPPGGSDDLVVTVGEVLDDGRRLVVVDTGGADLHEVLARRGVMPLPPYIHRALAEADRYQTVYAVRPGSAAAPTAGLHFTTELLERCRRAGAAIETVELVVGLDTFRPVTVDDLDDHQMHTESYRVPEHTWEACARADRVIAVGTTTVRALESAAVGGELVGRTELFIQPGFDFGVVDLLLTNFHLPRSTLLVMIEAFVGPRWRALYAEALTEGYRFLSFGDALLLGRNIG